MLLSARETCVTCDNTLRDVKQAGQWVADGWPIGKYLAMKATCAIAKRANESACVTLLCWA